MEKIKFNNRPNPCHTINGKMIWESRSTAVVAVIFGKFRGETYVLLEKRSKIMDQPGKWCVPCGYLDWDESGQEAIIREVYEETSIYLPNYKSFFVSKSRSWLPFFVNTDPSENRQNIALSYGFVYDFNKTGLPDTSFSNLEIDELRWVKLNDVAGYDVAFNHDVRIIQAEIYLEKDILPWWKWLIKKTLC